MADVDGAGVLPLELEVGLCDCSLVLSWVEDMVASLEGGGAVVIRWISSWDSSALCRACRGSAKAEVISWHLIGPVGWVVEMELSGPSCFFFGSFSEQFFNNRKRETWESFFGSKMRRTRRSIQNQDKLRGTRKRAILIMSSPGPPSMRVLPRLPRWEGETAAPCTLLGRYRQGHPRLGQRPYQPPRHLSFLP